MTYNETIQRIAARAGELSTMPVAALRSYKGLTAGAFPVDLSGGKQQMVTAILRAEFQLADDFEFPVNPWWSEKS